LVCSIGSMSPLILLTNDDGIAAAGLQALARQLGALGEVLVVAPDQEQSAVGHGVSLSRPLRAQQLGPGQIAVSGTPADCVLLALYQLGERRPDLVVSGINLGVNLGTDVFYSGTLAGALEGAIHDLPALAVSQELPALDEDDREQLTHELLERTARFAARVAARLLDEPLPAGLSLNINAPPVLTERFVWTRLGRRVYRDQVEQRLDPRGRPYYWIGGPPVTGGSPAGTDSHAIEQGLISITPLGLDLTAPLPEACRAWKLEP
jgi:5'-nucleotidase